MRKEMLLVLLVELVIFSSFAYGFDISTPGDSQFTGSSFFDTGLDIDFSISGILAWTYQFIADFFGVPMEDMKIRGGNLFAFVLVPILLAYMMFYAIIMKLQLFNDTPNIEKYIPLLLALMLAPLGIYRRFFFAMTAFFSTGTATLLYIFLFVALLGYGYRYMFSRGVRDISKGNTMIRHARNQGRHIKDVDGRLRGLYRRQIEVDNELAKLNGKKAGLKDDDINEGLNLAIGKLDAERTSIDKQIARLDKYQDKLSDGLENIIHGN